jgi:hypothetical protein
MTLGDFLLGKAPEEVERWGQGDSPFRNPATVVGTGGNRLDVFKAQRFEPTFDVLANVALPAVGTAQMVSRPIARSLGPKAAEMAEDYLTKQGAIANIVEPFPVRATEQFSKIDELGFHSPLENAILKIQQSKGTGEQFLKQLEKTPGVKTEELDVTGLKQYLLDHPTVTKQELLDQMATNRLQLQKKVLPKQEEIANNEADYQIQGGDIYHDDDYIRSMADDLHNDMKSDDVIRAQEREALLKADPDRYADHNTNPYIQARLEEDIDGVLYEQAKTKSEEMYYESPIRSYYDDYGYEIHGNDEMGYSVRGPGGEHVELGDNIYDIADVTHELRMHHLDRDILDYTGNEEDFAKYADYVLPGQHQNYREILTTYEPKRSPPSYEIKELPEANKEAGKNFGVYEGNKLINTWHGSGNAEDWVKNHTQNYKEYGNYESSHFDEPNILAHTRVNDRIINGKKTLFVEEIQSDWHQAGRKKGYLTGDPVKELHDYETNLVTRAREAMKENALKDGLTEQEADQFATKIVRNTDFNGMAKYLGETDQYTNIAIKSMNKDKLVPDAPYKKNWHELMMKQVFNEAVKGNYDAVAFTTGKQQAARYSLSKQISKVNFSEGGVLRAYDKNGNMVISKKLDSPDQIEDYIGKEPAKKLMEQEVKPTFIGEKESGEKIAHGNPNVFDARELSGVDLDVGGEPMKKFYDEIIPNFVNKYGKKYGIGVKKANLESPIQKNWGDFREWAIAKDPSINDSFLNNSWDNKDSLYKEYINSPAKDLGEEVHYFDLSDMAKKDIKEKGQPLFSGIGLAPAPLLMNDEDN